MEILDAKTAKTFEGGPTYSLQNRLFRAFWIVTWCLLASWTPPPMNRWRCFVLRCFGAKIAPTGFVYGSARIWYPPNLEVGEYARVSPSCTVYNVAKVTFCDYAVVSQRSHLCSATHDIEDTNFQTIARPITIGRWAWVAAECLVGPGVTVGEGAVLGARGVTFRDLDPWTVYVGNPAREIKKRHVRFAEPVEAPVDASA
jgi:putative colanic acid biosynthesis acetyltransferase WcaF